MKSEIYKLVEAGKTKKALEILRGVKTSDEDLKNQITLLNNRFAEYEKTKIGNLEDPSILSIELNKINQSVLLITGKLDAEILSSVFEPKNKFQSEKPKSTKWKLWAGIIGLIGLVASIAQIAGYSLKDIIEPKSSIGVTKTEGTQSERQSAGTIKVQGTTSERQSEKSLVIPETKSQRGGSSTVLGTNSQGKDEFQHPKSVIKQQETSKLVKIRLEVDAEFSAGDIFVNDKEVFPNNSSTLLIKYLEVPFQPNLEIKIKTSKDICTKKLSISESDFDNLKPIQVLCSK